MDTDFWHQPRGLVCMAAYRFAAHSFAAHRFAVHRFAASSFAVLSLLRMLSASYLPKSQKTGTLFPTIEHAKPDALAALVFLFLPAGSMYSEVCKLIANLHKLTCSSMLEARVPRIRHGYKS